MRMWNVPTELMCNQHLLGEHVEIHMFVGTINKGISIKGYVESGLFDTRLIKKRHEELVKEMESRGMNHKSSLPKYKVIDIGEINVENSLRELKRRCINCRRLQDE